MDIERLKPSFIEGFEVGDDIVIQEKIDGANFSIRYDKEDNSVKAFSRKKELNFSNNLRGAWEWSQKLSVDLIKSVSPEKQKLIYNVAKAIAETEMN